MDAAGWSEILKQYGGAATGALFKIGGAVGGGIASRKASRRAMRRVNAQLSEQEQRANNNFEELYNRDDTQTAVNQRMMSSYMDILNQKRKASAGALAVTGGGSTEAIAAEKANDNAALTDAFSRAAANGEAEKMRARDNYNQTLTGISNARIGQIQDYNAQRQQQIGNAMATLNSIGNDFAKASEKG